jgi:hypothetical protein
VNQVVVILATIVVVMAVVAWFDARCLADLSKTGDQDLRYLDRNTWALVIVLSFPIGPMLYLLYGKGPHRYP